MKSYKIVKYRKLVENWCSHVPKRTPPYGGTRHSEHVFADVLISIHSTSLSQDILAWKVPCLWGIQFRSYNVSGFFQHLKLGSVPLKCMNIGENRSKMHILGQKCVIKCSFWGRIGKGPKRTTLSPNKINLFEFYFSSPWWKNLSCKPDH